MYAPKLKTMTPVVFQWLLLFVTTFFTTTILGAPHGLSPIDPFLRDSNVGFANVKPLKDVETFFYNQTLDHFNYNPQSYATFPQRYYINSKWWGGANKNAPIFAYLGAEGPLDRDIPIIGFLTDNAPRFKALLVYIEHRFYGESNPVGSMAESVKNKTIRGYFNSAQALADYAEYPHIALGALASSAPILYFDKLTPQDGYYSIVTKDFKKSWNEIDRVASMPNGLSILSKKFYTCSPLKNSDELKGYLDSMYAYAAQYNAPPTYPTTRICEGIDGASNATDILDRISDGVIAYQPFSPCHNTTRGVSQTSIGWGWQTCSEMVIPIGITSNVSMFPSQPYNLQEVIDNCKSVYGVTPRPHWATTYYGGYDIKLVLSKFGSNIIFSNGLRDPYSSGGVLENISDEVLAVYTTNGSHCLDILASSKTDPDWLIKQRNDEVKIIRRWLTKYYHDLRLLKQ
ncbi:Peptidase S28 [Cynara cardunculus var. scolymus]|uniref:Peptidase S28 n=1 Tax=Cynara cardunculus var. scolymus TaxID=59895 RepID=A0A124SEH4_CYNCS|nr:Peptidase S28 [Cynara cardunculus var. scolymus]